MPIFTSYVSSSGDAPSAYGSSYDGADPKAGEMTGSLYIGHDKHGSATGITGSVQIAGFSAGGGFGNKYDLHVDVVVPSNYYSLMIGPIDVKSGYTLHISADSTVKIKDIDDV
tara:strand:- start:113 stop:451 length:339 start_codon:yes stop_codon:yes gene_type:complete